MSDEDVDEKLGPKPDAFSEEPQKFPGGADSVEDEKYGSTPSDPAVPDLNPDSNAAVEDVLPEEVAEPDDKTQEPEDEDAQDAEPGATSDEPAEQDKDEDPEPPV